MLESIEKARRIVEIASAAGKDDLVVCLISGGASALMPLPAPPVTLEEKQEVTRLLLTVRIQSQEQVAQAAEAHRQLESDTVFGKLVLTCDEAGGGT